MIWKQQIRRNGGCWHRPALLNNLFAHPSDQGEDDEDGLTPATLRARFESKVDKRGQIVRSALHKLYLFSHSSLNTPPKAFALIPGGKTHGIGWPPCLASDASLAKPWNFPLSFTEKMRMTFLYRWKQIENVHSYTDIHTYFFIKVYETSDMSSNLGKVLVLVLHSDLRTFALIVSAHPYCARNSHGTSCIERAR